MKTPTALLPSGQSAGRALGQFATKLCIVAALSGQLVLAQELIPPGTLDSTFESPIPDGGAVTVLVQPDGRLLVGGRFSIPRGGDNLRRFTRDGAHDSTFAPTSGVPWNVTQLALQHDGKALVGNKGGVEGGYPSIGLSRFLPDGSRDPGFRFRLPTNSINPGRWSGFWTTALAVQPDDKILLAGRYERDHLDYLYWSGVSLRRLLPDGSGDQVFTFTFPAPESIGVLVLLPDQRLLVAGDQLARLNTDGTQDPGFVRTILAAGAIACCVTQADGKILVGGNFTNIQGHARCRIARIWPDGQLDLSFDPPLNTRSSDPNDTTVRTLAVQADGRILVGGDFETMNGLPYTALARLNSDGTLDTTFPPVVRRAEEEDTVAVRTIVLQDGDRALIGGGHMVTSGGFDAGGLFRIHLGEPSPRLFVLHGPGDTVQLTFLHPDGLDFTVLTSTSLRLPASKWTVLGPATNLGGHLYQFTDRLAPSEFQRFYRLQR